MRYCSTRNAADTVSAAEAVKEGIAPDGGLFVPAARLIANDELRGFAGDYQELCVKVLSIFFPEFTAGELQGVVAGAYGGGKFPLPAVAPLSEAGGVYFLELWHGPTCAFKDMALQVLPRLLPLAVAKTGAGADIAILVATSGDTGKAALEGFRDVPGTRVIVFYPEEGVSEMQRRQMVTQEGENVHVVAVRGNFDDAQGGVKAIFRDKKIKEVVGAGGFRFSSANSINWGRLAPQVVYYFHAYNRLLARGRLSAGDRVNFVVPTGNFGNILAGYYAWKMGLPVNKFICAANSNNVLTDFINTGTYDRNREFYRTISPSMDILISSNLERLLFEAAGRDDRKIISWMEELASEGRYTVDRNTSQTIRDLFWSGCATDEETMDTISSFFTAHGYLADPHTAVGINVYNKYVARSNDETPAVVVSTASPFKFNRSVAGAVLGKDAVRSHSEYELTALLAAETGREIPPALQNLETRPVLHSDVVSKEGMKEMVVRLLS